MYKITNHQPPVTNLNRYDLASLGLITFIFILSIARFNYLPQYVDAYYHLSCANGFIKSGGWVGWSWWDYAPAGRPQIYPPLYHIILAFLQKIGLSGLNSVRVTEVITPGLFFFTFWLVLRRIASSFFSFLSLFTLSSFFSFYSSVSANVPASLALVFGFLSWYFFKKGKLVSSSIFLILSFYTHAGIPWIFFISFLLVTLLKEYRLLSLKIILLGLLGYLPLLIHQLCYLEYISFRFLKETYFSHLSIFILILGIISLFFTLKKELKTHLFAGYLLGSIIVFFRYPYRFLSAQGIIGLAFFCSLFLEKYLPSFKKLSGKIIFALLCMYLFFFHTTIDLEGGKFKLNLLNSTYYNFFTGKIYRLLEFRSFFYPQYYLPLVEVIQKNTKTCEIISSNLKITGQIFSSLSGRATSNSMLQEVRGKSTDFIYTFAKVVVWMKPEDRTLYALKDKLGWKKIYENEIASVFKNPRLDYCIRPLKAKVSFRYITIIFIIFFFVYLRDSVKIRN
jgi:hypothetical protein